MLIAYSYILVYTSNINENFHKCVVSLLVSHALALATGIKSSEEVVPPLKQHLGQENHAMMKKVNQSKELLKDIP